MHQVPAYKRTGGGRRSQLGPQRALLRVEPQLLSIRLIEDTESPASGKGNLALTTKTDSEVTRTLARCGTETIVGLERFSKQSLAVELIVGSWC